MCLVAAAAAPRLLRSWRSRSAGAEAEAEAEADGESEASAAGAEVRKPSSESERAAKPKKKRAAKKPSGSAASGGSGGGPLLPEGGEGEAALAASLPVLTTGERVWHKASGEMVEVVKVHHDDPPPYYTVRTAAGLERSTIRTRLETVGERAASAAAGELCAAEARAAACAAALLAEEATDAQKGRRKPNSGREKQAKKRS